MAEKEVLTLSGIVEHIKYKNEENGYTVCLLDTGEEMITVVGRLPFVYAGEEIKVSGNWSLHANYGRQFNAEFCEKHLPVNIAGISRYLSSGAVKGIGKATAAKIVDLFGERALEVIEQYPEKLTEIRGISIQKAKKISETFKLQFGVRSLLLFFSQYGITPSLALKIWKKWGSFAIDKIKEMCKNNKPKKTYIKKA